MMISHVHAHACACTRACAHPLTCTPIPAPSASACHSCPLYPRLELKAPQNAGLSYGQVSRGPGCRSCSVGGGGLEWGLKTGAEVEGGAA